MSLSILDGSSLLGEKHVRNKLIGFTVVGALLVGGAITVLSAPPDRPDSPLCNSTSRPTEFEPYHNYWAKVAY
jgi:hypothetical protein